MEIKSFFRFYSKFVFWCSFIPNLFLKVRYTYVRFLRCRSWSFTTSYRSYLSAMFISLLFLLVPVLSSINKIAFLGLFAVALWPSYRQRITRVLNSSSVFPHFVLSVPICLKVFSLKIVFCRTTSLLPQVSISSVRKTVLLSLP